MPTLIFRGKHFTPSKIWKENVIAKHIDQQAKMTNIQAKTNFVSVYYSLIRGSQLRKQTLHQIRHKNYFCFNFRE